jgi:hypothetical protein
VQHPSGREQGIEQLSECYLHSRLSPVVGAEKQNEGPRWLQLGVGNRESVPVEHPIALRAKLAHPPRDDASAAEKEAFAGSTEFGNTLPMHLEWKRGPGQYPRAIIQPMTGREFLIATAWLDIVRQEKVQVCQRTDCGRPFTGREQKYCSEPCAHLMAVRAFRERERKKKMAGKSRV